MDTAIFLWGASLLAAVTVGIVMFAAGFRWPGGSMGDASGGARQLVEFNLMERDGRTVTREDLRGKFLVVNFVHTGCSISCAVVNRRMAEVQKLSAGQGDVQLLSLTVDPGTDTPAVLSKFAGQFGADAQRWWFLTGTKPSVYRVIESSFLARDTNSIYQAMPGGFLKADHIALVDREGVVRKFFPGMKSESVAGIMKALDELRRESPGH